MYYEVAFLHVMGRQAVGHRHILEKVFCPYIFFYVRQLIDPWMHCKAFDN